jgi:hypothetical protein
MLDQINGLVSELNRRAGREKYRYAREVMTLVSDTGTGVGFDSEEEMVRWLREQCRVNVVNGTVMRVPRRKWW